MRDNHPLLRRLQSAILHLGFIKSTISEAFARDDLISDRFSVNSLPANQERKHLALAIIISLLLHLTLLLLLLPSKTGLASFGTTGLGSVNGSGMAVTLVEASEIMPPEASMDETSASVSEAVASEAVATTETDDPLKAVKPAEQTEAQPETETDSKTKAVKSDTSATSDTRAEATAGAHGQNGQTDTDLWNAIAPCWNKVIDRNTVPATLTISFDGNGEIAAPPVIERDPAQSVTPRNLRSESLALQALAACGAYPMAKGQQNITVQFLLPGQAAEALPIKQTNALATRH